MGQDHSGELDQRIKDAWDFLMRHSSSEDITLTQKEVKFIYGNKGGLRICASLDGGSDKKFLNIANFIKQNYQKLKIESVAASAKDGKIKIENLQGQIKQSLQNYMEALEKAGADTEKLNKLQEKIKEVDDNIQSWAGRRHSHDRRVTLIRPYSSWDVVLEDLQGKAERARADMRKTEKRVSDATSPAATAALQFRKEYNKFIENLKNSVDIYKNNQESLSRFRDDCGTEAAEYLKHNKNNIEKIAKGKFKDKGPCKTANKILFACLVAAVSGSESDRKLGFSSFSKITKAITY